MKTTYKINNTIYVISDHMAGIIERYVEERLHPGDFLTAVICNDLAGAIGRADEENIKNLPAYVSYFRWEAPGKCWGSKQKMEAWLKGGKLL